MALFGCVSGQRAGYMLLRWSVDASLNHSLKEEQYRLWLSDPSALFGVENSKLAPGFTPPLLRRHHGNRKTQ